MQNYASRFATAIAGGLRWAKFNHACSRTDAYTNPRKNRSAPKSAGGSKAVRQAKGIQVCRLAPTYLRGPGRPLRSPSPKTSAQADRALSGSKSHTQTYRAAHAIFRAASRLPSEMRRACVPNRRSQIQGRYIRGISMAHTLLDLCVNGFRQTAFGHAPDFVSDAVKAPARHRLRAWARKPTALGPQQPAVRDARHQRRDLLQQPASEAYGRDANLARARHRARPDCGCSTDDLSRSSLTGFGQGAKRAAGEPQALPSRLEIHAEPSPTWSSGLRARTRAGCGNQGPCRTKFAAVVVRIEPVQKPQPASPTRRFCARAAQKSPRHRPARLIDEGRHRLSHPLGRGMPGRLGDIQARHGDLLR